MIVEGIITTRNKDGTVNVAPMGPVVDDQLTSFMLRPFNTSRTFANLRRTCQGVFHMTDDVLLLACAAINRLTDAPPLVELTGFQTPRLADCCRWFALNVESIDDTQPRCLMQTRIVSNGSERPFFGFNRAKHAVVEAAILATRVGILPAEEIRDELRRLRTPVEKTCGDTESQAFTILEGYIDGALSEVSA